MWWCCKNINLFLHFLVLVLLASSLVCQAHNWIPYKFVVKEALHTRLCHTKKILTVNGQFPGPTLYAFKGQTVLVEVHNQAAENITIHWHGVKQPRNPWSDGPEFITQCPIQPGNMFRQWVIFSEEEGTLWWHAHSDWSRATVHGAIVIYPKPGTIYPFPQPYKEELIILGEWWKEDIREVLGDTIKSGGQPINSSAYIINGQPGDLYPCSKKDIYELTVEPGKTYLLRIINAAVNVILYFGIAKHNLTVVAADASYTKPLTRNYIAISPGQTYDCLLHTDQEPGYYYMAANAYVSNTLILFHNETATAGLKYNETHVKPPHPPLPSLPFFNDTPPALNFTGSLRSLASREHPINVPLQVNTRILTTISFNTLPCPNITCEGPNGTRLAASMNNLSFVFPSVDILEAYYYSIKGVYGNKFPSFPPYVFNFTAEYQALELLTPKKRTEVKILKYGTTVEIVIQGTSLVGSLEHPIHLHGYNFYVVGQGVGNFDENKDPKKYNLVDPPRRNDVPVPKDGWVAIRFKAENPGVWLMHCHFDRHLTWGMATVFIVKDGKKTGQQILPPPPDMPPC